MTMRARGGRRLATGTIAVLTVLGGVLLPTGIASAATVNYVPVLPTSAYVGDTVTFGESCPQEVGATCPTGGTGTVSIDGSSVGNFGPQVPYQLNWQATLGTHTVTIAFTDVTSTQHNTNGTIVVLPRQPSAPQNLAFNVDTNNHAAVSWSAPSQSGASNLTGYEVSVDGGAPQSTTQTSFDVTYVAPGGHTVTVAATNSDGTGPTASLTFFRPVTQTASAPQNLSPVNGPNASLSWAPPALDGGSQITQYAVQVDSGAFYYQDAASTTFNLYQIPGLTYGNHTVAVSAVNANGQGATATETVLFANVPDAPGNVTVLSPANAPLVQWTAPSGNGAPIVGYTLYVDNHRVTYNPGPTATSQVITGLSYTQHTLHLYATNAFGNSNQVSMSFQVVAPTAPFAPQNLTVDTTNNHAVLNWTAPLTDGGSPVTGYVVTIGGNAPVTVPALTYDMSSFSPGQYNVTVAAKNAIGTGPTATLSVVRPPVSVPDQVSGVVATNGPVPAVAWAVPAHDGGQTITGYLVSVDGGTPINISGVNTTSYAFQTASLAYGPHTVTIEAVNPVGLSPASTPVTVTYESVPTAPTITQISTGVAQPVVTWSASTVQGGSIQKYTVYVDGTSVGSTADGNTLQFTLPLETPGTHSVAVTATSLFSESTQSPAVQYTAPSAPDAPTGVSATSTLDGVISVNWTQPVNDGGAPITGYTITVDPGTSQVVQNITGSASGVNVALTGTFARGQHVVTVAAVNAVGTSSSATANVTVTSPVNITIGASTAPSVGGNETISGVVHIGTGTTPAAAESVSLQTVATGNATTTVATATTGADGSYSFTVPIKTATTYQVVETQDAAHFLAAGTSVTVTVTPFLKASLKETTLKGAKFASVTLKSKTKVMFTATVLGAPAGSKMFLQEKVGSGWKTVAVGNVNPTFGRAYWTPTKKGTFTLRAIISPSTKAVVGTTTGLVYLKVT